ncbi:recombinase family protein [Streptomyces sp. NPDC004752]
MWLGRHSRRGRHRCLRLLSGFRGFARPELQRVLTRLAELDVIVFFKIDRLVRSTVDPRRSCSSPSIRAVALASAHATRRR